MLRLLVALGYGVVSSLTRLAILAARPLIVLLLRQLVRNRSFWERGLRGAWVRKVRPCQSLSAASWKGAILEDATSLRALDSLCEEHGTAETDWWMIWVGKRVRCQPCYQGFMPVHMLSGKNPAQPAESIKPKQP